MKIELYLDDNLIEINKDIDFVLNKQYTELTDLTSIIVDYSKTIKIPMTPRNNEVFNFVYRLEHQVFGNSDVISYDPSQKIPMTMLFNGSMVMEGYAVLNSVNMKDKTYEINLYGQLGKIFSDLKERTIREYKDPGNGMFKPVKMCTKTVADSILRDDYNTDWTSNDWTNFWGMAPQLLGEGDNFDMDTYEVGPNTPVMNDEVFQEFTKTINTTRSGDPEGWCADSYVKDGLDFNQYLEMRTYLGRPYVYVNKLVQLVQNEINNSDFDGYQMVLDQDWFRSDNQYYNSMVYFPGQESIIDNGEEGGGGTVYWSTNEITMDFPLDYLPSATSDLSGYTYNGDVSTKLITITPDSGTTETPTVTLKADGVIIRDRVSNIRYRSDFNEKGRWGYYGLVNPYIIDLRYIGIYDSTGNLIYKLYLTDDVVYVTNDWWRKVTINDVWSILRKISIKNVVPNSVTFSNGSSNTGTGYYELTQVYNFGNVVLNTMSWKFKMGCDRINLYSGKVLAEDVDDSTYNYLHPFKNEKYKSVLTNSNSTYSGGFIPITSLEISNNNFRSGSVWTIKDVLGYDFNPFLWLLDYAKKFRLFFDIDYQTKTITLKGNYFANPTYNLVTVDYSKEVKIEPVVEKYKSVNYGYREDDSRKGIRYKKNNGVEYGDMKINTNINITNETMSLNPDEEEGVFIPVNQSAITFSNLNAPSGTPISYQNALLTNKVITTLDKDNKIQYYPFYAFRDTNIVSPVNFWWLSDDTPNQKNTGTYTYLDHSNGGWHTTQEGTIDGTPYYYLLKMKEIPQFDNYVVEPIIENGTTINNYIWWVTFGVPKEVYNGYIPDNIASRSIYRRWQNWLNELFNSNNKKVTCYVRMSYPEFINFKFNQFFVIDNCVFLVNKIIDFNPNSTDPTKVELIQISDVDNLLLP